MKTRSTNVIPSLVCSLEHQRLQKNSTSDVPIISMFYIIICANCIFLLYTFPFAHSEDDDECCGDLIANGWIFDTPSLSTFLNSSSTFVLFNNSTSSSCLHLCSFLCTSFSLAIIYNFSMAFFALMLLWTLELQKRAQFPATSANYFPWLPFFSSLNIPPVAFISLPTHCLLINTWSSKLIWPISISLSIFCMTMWKQSMSSLWMNAANFIFQLLHTTNLPLIKILIAPCSPCTPFAKCAYSPTDCVNSYVDYDHTYVDYTDFSIDCANKSDVCANTPNDWTNIIASLVNILDISSSDLWIPNPSFLQLLFIDLLFIYKSKINIMFTARFLI